MGLSSERSEICVANLGAIMAQEQLRPRIKQMLGEVECPSNIRLSSTTSNLSRFFTATVEHWDVFDCE